MIMRKTYALTLAVLFPLAGSAQVSLYFGAGAHGARVQRYDLEAISSFTDEFPGPPPSEKQYNWSTNTFAGDDLGYRAFVGARVGKYFAFEGGYLNLGQPETSFNYHIPSYPPGPSCVSPPVGNCVRPQTDNVLRLQNAIDGYEFYGLGMLPITERLEVFGKIGLYAWKSKFTASDSVAALQQPNPPQVPEFTITPASPIHSDGVDLAVGGGVNFKMSGNFLLRVEGAWYDIQGTKTAWTAGFDLIYQIPL